MCHPDIVFLSLISFYVPLKTFMQDGGHMQGLKIVFSLMGLNVLEENRNGKRTRKTVFIVTFKLFFFVNVQYRSELT